MIHLQSEQDGTTPIDPLESLLTEFISDDYEKQRPHLLKEARDEIERTLAVQRESITYRADGNHRRIKGIVEAAQCRLFESIDVRGLVTETSDYKFVDAILRAEKLERPKKNQDEAEYEDTEDDKGEDKLAISSSVLKDIETGEQSIAVVRPPGIQTQRRQGGLGGFRRASQREA
ncbi:hypothetical protein BDZ45DRAFT_171949 [Acephala macrosclerotiorum]|nr:hypothetical protein BDZ45DRAFT_171949 [Acephala macrosclerotiorum]